MDTQGNVRRLEKDEELRPNEIPLDSAPDPHCKTCWGRGHVRWIVENIVETKLCKCVKRKSSSIRFGSQKKVTEERGQDA